MASSTPAGKFAVAWLLKFIEDNKIKNQAKVDLNRLWEMMVHADESSLKHGWIVNCSIETVHFYVYRSNDTWQYLHAHDVYVRPGEKAEVHGGMLYGQGYFPEEHENMIVYKDNKDIPHNVKKGTLHFWTGSLLIEHGLSIEKFKNLCYNSIETESRKYSEEMKGFIVNFFTVALNSYCRLMDKFY